MVRDPAAASWQECRHVLERDPQARAVHPLLSPAAAEAAFRAHVAGLLDVASSAFGALLQDRLQTVVPTSEEEAALGGVPPALATWEAAEVMLRDDVRFARLPAGLREGAWRLFVGDAMWSRDHPGQKRRRDGGGDDGINHHSDPACVDAAKRAKGG